MVSIAVSQGRGRLLGTSRRGGPAAARLGAEWLASCRSDAASQCVSHVNGSAIGLARGK